MHQYGVEHGLVYLLVAAAVKHDPDFAYSKYAAEGLVGLLVEHVDELDIVVLHLM